MTAQDGGLGRRISSRISIGKLSGLQQSFEESRTGQILISGLVATIVLVGVAWNLPESPIKSSLAPLVKPATVVNLNQPWSVYAPSPKTRLETVEVHVTMADGAKRVWTLEPGTLVDRLFASSHWQRLMEYSVLNGDIRPGVSRWAARQVTGPSERAVHVAMILWTKPLSPPGEEASQATATKVLYEADLTGQR
jgi:hypothetical protein